MLVALSSPYKAVHTSREPVLLSKQSPNSRFTHTFSLGLLFSPNDLPSLPAPVNTPKNISKMKVLSALLVLAAAALASAQSQCAAVAANIPSCGVRGLSPNPSILLIANLPSKVSCLSAAASSAGCAQTDFACQCSSSQSSAIQSAALDCIVQACGAVTGLQVSTCAQSVCACVATASPTGSASSQSQATPAQILAGQTTTTTNSKPQGSAGGYVQTAGGGYALTPSSSPITTFTGGAHAIGAMGGVIGGVLAVVAAL